MVIRLVLFLILAAVGTGTYMARQDDQDTQPSPSAFMKRKLDHTCKIVSGLATEDFAKIEKSAQDLMLLSQEADWNVITTQTYLQMSSEFRSSAERLRENARQKNLDGATLAYFEVTLNCVRCHKYIRDDRRSNN